MMQAGPTVVTNDVPALSGQVTHFLLVPLRQSSLDLLLKFLPPLGALTRRAEWELTHQHCIHVHSPR